MKTDSGIVILGAGAWGTALAQLYADHGRVTLWCRRAGQAKKISAAGENTDYFPGIKLHENITVISDTDAIKYAEVMLAAIPTQYLPEVLTAIKNDLPNVPLLICAKGIHALRGELLPNLVREILPRHPVGMMSGPNLAHDIARGLPAATTIALDDETTAQNMSEKLRTPSFRPYASTDVLGVALAGALKNILALAAGMTIGAGLGENARAALVTRGMAEITRLGIAMGARGETFMGLAGMGDVMLTCHAETSRNFSCGFALGRGQTLDDIMNARSSVTEGVTTVFPALLMAQKYNVELPICQAVANVVNNDMNVGAALAQLMARPLKAE
jgi:glycerol-3-phosphate dehydrogenase (NAD(P)+)